MLEYTTAFRAIFVIAIITEVLGRGSLIPGTRQEKSAENELEKPRLDGRIVGGEPTTIKKHPYQASIQVNGILWSNHICGGTILTAEYILTACHCVVGRKASEISVRAGSSEAARGGKLMRVSQIVQHPNCNLTTVDFDFALVKVSPIIEFDETKQPVELPNAEYELLDGAMCTTTGWGNTQNAAESSRVLREVDVPIVNREICNDKYTRYGGITARMICAGLEEGGKDACQGDSGGPLVSPNGPLVGVVSWGNGCGEEGYPGVYAKVTSEIDWIRGVIA